MTDQVNRQEGQEPPPNTAPAGQEPAGQQQGQEPTPPEFDVSQIQDPAVRAWAQAMEKSAREARQEAARYRTERNSGREQFQQFRQQHESEQDRLERERKERDSQFERLQAENRDLKVGGDARRAATEANAFNPELVYSHIRDRIETDGSGKPTNLADLIKDLRKTDPYLFRRAEADAGAGRGQGNRPARSMNDEIRRLAGRQVD